MKQTTLLLTLLVLIMACSETVSPTDDNFVVEGFITANAPVDNIKVKMTSPIDARNVTNAPITNARVMLSDQHGEYLLEYDVSTEKYRYPGNDLDIVIGSEVQIEVQVDDRSATAQTRVPEAPTGLALSEPTINIPQLVLNFSLRDRISELFEEERITLSWDAVEGRRFFVVIESQVEELDPILPEQIPEQSRELLGSFRFISEPSETPEFEIIGIALETYGRHVAKVFTVNEEYADLFDNLEQDSRDLNEPPSNIVNALGIFTAFAVDSIEFNVTR